MWVTGLGQVKQFVVVVVFALSFVTVQGAPAKQKKIPWFYVHAGIGGGIGGVRSGDYKKILDPFKNDVAWGYDLGVHFGFRNLYQLELRPRAVASVASRHYLDI